MTTRLTPTAPEILYSQPQYAAQINTANPITRSLVFAFNSAVPVTDSVHSAIGGVVGNVSTAYGRAGKALTVDASARVEFPSCNDLNILGDITIVAVIRATSTSSDAVVVAKCAANGGPGDAQPFAFGTGATGGAVYMARSGAVSFDVWTGSQPVPVGIDSVIAASMGNDMSVPPKFYINGVQDTGTAVNNYSGSGTGLASATTAVTRVGNRGDLNTPFVGSIYSIFIFSRVLTAAEIASVSANPWQLFKAPRRYNYIAVATGGGSSRRIQIPSVIRTTQPQDVARINWANPITQKLNFAYTMIDRKMLGYAKGVAFSDMIVAQNGVTGANRFGLGINPQGQVLTDIACKMSESTNYSLFACASGVVGGSGVSQNILDDDNASSIRNFQFRLNNNVVELITFVGGSPYFATQTVPLSTSQLASGITMGGSVGPTTISSYQNGSPLTTTTNLVMNAPLDSIRFSGFKGGGSSWSSGAISLIAGWTRTLTDAEQASLNNNPWQIFK